MCMFSGYKIHPGHGKLYTRIDGERAVQLSRMCVCMWGEVESWRVDGAGRLLVGGGVLSG